MLYDEVSVPGIVDSECAHEFLKEATRLASTEELQAIGWRLEEKSRVFSELLHEDAISSLNEQELRAVLDKIFLVRRKAGRLMKTHGVEEMRGKLSALLYGDAPPGERFEGFITGVPSLKFPVAILMASELMHYTQPERYWLWTHWLWDPATEGGALPLVLRGDADLAGATPGEIYTKVGRAIGQVGLQGRAEGFTGLGRGPFGTTVYLACVYAVYMYTVFKMRLSGEFNRILPELPEFTRRLLGVHKPIGRVQHA